MIISAYQNKNIYFLLQVDKFGWSESHCVKTPKPSVAAYNAFKPNSTSEFLMKYLIFWWKTITTSEDNHSSVLSYGNKNFTKNKHSQMTV